ncbi:MAG: ATP-binding protein [Gemmatimonas sp.]
MRTLPTLRKLALGIRGQVLGGILVVTLALVAVTLNDLRQAWSNYTDARQVEVVNAHVNGLIVAARHYALERGRTNVVLRGVEPAFRADVEFLSEQRRLADEALDGVLSGLATIADEEIAPRISEIAILRGRIEDLRHRVDEEIAKAPQERALSVADFWFPTITRLVERLEDLSLVLGKGVGGGELSILSDLKVAGFSLRLSAGTEASMIGSAIASGRPLVGPQLTEVARLSGRVASDWERVERLTALVSDAAIPEAVARARDLYFGEFNRMQEVGLAAASAGGNYPFSRSAFSDVSVGALESIIAIVDAAEQASVAQARRDRLDARSDLVNDALWLIAGLLVAMATAWIMIRHVIAPIEAATGTMRRFAAGDMSAPIRGLQAQNEVGEMARALAEFRRITTEHSHVLLSRNRMLELAEELSNLGHWRIDAKTRELTWSRGVYLIHGRDPKTYTPTLETSLTCYHPEDRATVERVVREAFENATGYNLDVRIIRPEGNIRNVEIVARPETDGNGNVVALFGVLRDITRRKRSEEELRRLNARLKGDVIERTGALRESQARMRAIFEAEPQCLQLISRDGVVLEINPAGLAMWEAKDPNEIIGKSAFPWVIAAQRADFRALHRRVLGGDAATEEFDIEGLRGGRRSVFLTAVPLRDWTGEVVAALYVAQDVSDRRAIEAQLRQAQKMEAVGQLTGGIAHDFNNLLGVIVGNLDLLRLDMENNPVPRQLELVDRMLDAAERGASLTHRLLAFSRRQTLHPQLVDVNRLVSGMSSMLRRTLGGAIEVSAREAPGLWSAKVDPGHLESAILNLAINARDAMPEGGRLGIEMANVTLGADFVERNPGVEPADYVMISVADNGVGMPPEVLERCFDPFFTTKEVGKGSGLGLSMVYGFVRQSGGHVDIESEPGFGTTVRIYLPRSREEATERTDTDAILQVPRGTGQTVLVVEDNLDMRVLSVSALKDLGYRPLEAANAFDALRLLEDDPAIQLLFSDVLLPGGMTGFDLAREAAQRRPGLKVLFTSGYTEKAVMPDDVARRGWQLVAKPYRWAELGRKIAAALSEPAV